MGGEQLASLRRTALGKVQLQVHVGDRESLGVAQPENLDDLTRV